MVHCSTGSDSGSGNGRADKLCVSVYRAIVKSSPEIVRSSLLPFFTFAADDFAHTVSNLKTGRFSHVKGTITRGIRFRSGVGTKSTLRPFTGARRGQKGRNSKPEWFRAGASGFLERGLTVPPHQLGSLRKRYVLFQ